MKPITKLKNMYLKTELVKDGKSRAIIIIPEKEEYLKLAKQIQAKIKGFSRAEIRIEKDNEVSLENCKNNMLVLGSMRNNKVILKLYHQHYCFVDDFYPGKNGYVIRTIHNPFGNGKNFVLLGGSNFERVIEAVKRFLPKLKTIENNLILDRIIETSSNYNISLQASAELKEKIKKEIEYRITEGNKLIAFVPVLASGLLYYQTGNIGWSQIFKECFLEFFERAMKSYTLMGMAEHWAWNLIMVWDLVEEAPVFSNRERLKITNEILFLTEKASKMSPLRNFPPEQIRWNHQTFNALTLFYGARYFQKYYHLKKAKEWMKIADTCFQSQAKASASWDESGSYGHFVLRHLLNYSLTKGDFTSFENGNAKKMADWVVVIHDNLSNIVTYGDCADYKSYKQSNAYIPILSKAAWYYQDGRYSWMIKKIKREEFHKENYKLKRERPDDKSIFSSFYYWNWYDGPYHCNIKSVLPRDMLGIKAIPLDKMFYDAEGKGQGIVIGKKPLLKKCFDKISFRNSFNPKKEYLLLEGLSGGQHKHGDGNSILRYTDKNRIWLVDYGYTQEMPEKYHNTVIVIKDGKTASLPLMCSLEKMVDFNSVGFTSTLAASYNGVDWLRNIIWNKGKFFLVIDRMEAKEKNEFDFRCLWRMLGKVKIKDNILISEQKNKRFYLKNAGEIKSHLREENLKFVGKVPFWQGYGYADNIVKIWQQRIKGEFKKSEKIYFINLFYSTDNKEKKNFSIKRINQSCVYIKEEKAYLGVDGLQYGDIETDAEIFYLSPHYIALVKAKKLYWKGKIFEFPEPISIEKGTSEINFLKNAKDKIG